MFDQLMMFESIARANVHTKNTKAWAAVAAVTPYGRRMVHSRGSPLCLPWTRWSDVLKTLRFIDAATHRSFAVQILRGRKIEGVGRDERLQEEEKQGRKQPAGMITLWQPMSVPNTWRPASF